MGRIIDQTGLNERLRQHSRHSGMLVGVSMLIAMALAIGAFIWIFFWIDPLLADFTGRTGVPQATPVAVRATRAGRTPSAAAANAQVTPQVPTPTALALPSPTTTPAFVATHVIVDYGQAVNLRAGPTATSGRIALLPPGTRLKALNEEERVGDVVWLKFQTERGDVGWIRTVDVTRLP